MSENPEEMIWRKLKNKWIRYEEAKKGNNIQDMEKHLKEIRANLRILGILPLKKFRKTEDPQKIEKMIKKLCLPRTLYL
jgi:hypothetical protein